jgi:fumarate reductase subunit C
MASYPQFQPREYHRSFSNWWWLGRFNYLKFILREFSCVFVGYFLIVTLAQVWPTRHSRRTCGIRW